MGPVLRRNGKYYRAIRPDAADHTRVLFRKGIIKRLHDIGFLNRQELSDLAIEGYAFTVESETADFSISASVFPFILLQRAALKWIDASLVLEEHGLALTDGHLANFFVFGNSAPRWIDLGSIVALPSDTENHTRIGIDEFQKFYVAPLLAVSRNPPLANTVRIQALWTGGKCVDGTWLRGGGLDEESAMYLTGFQIFHYGISRRDMLEHVREVVSGISFEWPRTMWSHYSVDRLHQVPSIFSLSPRAFETLEPRLSVLQRELKISDTVLDLGGNSGFYGLHAAAAGARVIINDLDELSLTRGLERVDQEPSWKVAFVVNDAMRLEFSELPEADVVLALALTHHLRLGQLYHFRDIASRFAALTRRVLITEFMPWGLNIDRAPDYLPLDYTLEAFLLAFSKYFSSVEIACNQVSNAIYSRTLIICRK